MKVIYHPIEFIKAQVMFAMYMSKFTGLSFEASIIEYTDLYIMFTGKKWDEEDDKGNYSKDWLYLMLKVKNISDVNQISKIIFEDYSKRENGQKELKPEEKYSHGEDEDKFGSFTVTYNDYCKEREQVRLHFTPMRNGLFEKEVEKQVGDLSSYYLINRKEEFKDLVKYIKDNPEKYKGAKYFVSSTWLQNIPNYQILFPRKYSQNENRELVKDSFLGLWGQFEKWNYTGNIKNLEIFENNLIKAKSKEECVDAFPYPVYKIRVPLEEMFEYYSL